MQAAHQKARRLDFAQATPLYTLYRLPIISYTYIHIYICIYITNIFHTTTQVVQKHKPPRRVDRPFLSPLTNRRSFSLLFLVRTKAQTKIYVTLDTTPGIRSGGATRLIIFGGEFSPQNCYLMFQYYVIRLEFNRFLGE